VGVLRFDPCMPSCLNALCIEHRSGFRSAIRRSHPAAPGIKINPRGFKIKKPRAFKIKLRGLERFGEVWSPADVQH